MHIRSPRKIPGATLTDPDNGAVNEASLQKLGGQVIPPTSSNVERSPHLSSSIRVSFESR